jgi:DNA-binding Lrp family transcriptional regulator
LVAAGQAHQPLGKRMPAACGSPGRTWRQFVEVNVDRQSTDLAKDFRRKVLQHPQVQACHMVSGTIDFMLEVVASDLDSFGRFIDGELLSMPAVKDASSSIVLSVVKPKRTMITGAK